MRNNVEEIGIIDYDWINLNAALMENNKLAKIYTECCDISEFSNISSNITNLII